MIAWSHDCLIDLPGSLLIVLSFCNSPLVPSRPRLEGWCIEPYSFSKRRGVGWVVEELVEEMELIEYSIVRLINFFSLWCSRDDTVAYFLSFAIEWNAGWQSERNGEKEFETQRLFFVPSLAPTRDFQSSWNFTYLHIVSMLYNRIYVVCLE